jgi:hypothetical protein
MDEEVPIAVAAQRLGVSPDTIKRRIKHGELQARRVGRPQGYRWLVSLPDTAASVDAGSMHSSTVALAVAQAEVRRLEATVRLLSRELDVRQREISQLHVLLGQGRAQLPVHSGADADVVPTRNSPVHQRRQSPQHMPLWDRLLRVLRGR